MVGRVDAEFVKAWEAAGLDVTFEVFGKGHGISRERVRQIIERWEVRNGVRIPRLADKRRAAKERIALLRRLHGLLVLRRDGAAPTLIQRLLHHAVLVRETGCWRWNGRVQIIGRYHRPSFSALGERYAQRVAYRLWHGPIPENWKVVWECGEEICINPLHLKAISPKQACERSPSWDSARGSWKHTFRRRTPATHCAKGHEFTPANTAWNPGWRTTDDGTRVKTRNRHCKQCRDDRKRSYPPQVRPKPTPAPPLPLDSDERYLELRLRRVFRQPRRKQLSALNGLLAEYRDDAIGPVAEEGELFADYFHRVWYSGDKVWSAHDAWFRSRILSDARVRELLSQRKAA